MFPWPSNRPRWSKSPFPHAATILIVALLIVANQGPGQSTPRTGGARDSSAPAARAAGLIARVEKLEAQAHRFRRVQSVHIVSRKPGPAAQVVWEGLPANPVHYYAYPHWPGMHVGWPFDGEHVEQFMNEKWLSVVDDQGNPLEFGEEVIEVVVVPHRRFAEPVRFWDIEARPHPQKRNQIQLVAVGSYNIFNGPGIQPAPTTDALSPTVHVELIVIYRDKPSP
jgi:hypothetical protein